MLIEREAALKAVHEAIAEGKSWYSALSHLPSAEKKGKWLKGNMPTYGGYKCSICGDNSISKFSYCPTCGARMVEE